MLIANPLYDHAFKYLMSNERLARKVLSVILEKEVLDLELTQQEFVVEDKQRHLTMYRLDFKARIRSAEGQEEVVLIELQKSKLPTNLLRFRSYLGLAYGQKTVQESADGQRRELAYPLVSIYIVGYNIQDIPVMAAKVDRRVLDMSRHEELTIESDFINMLTHPCYILQVRRLPAERRSRIERFMTLFNQAWVKEDNFILDLEEVPEEFKDIAEYLQRPLSDDQVRGQLEAEQAFERVFAEQEARAEHYRLRAEAEALEKEEERRQKEEERRQKEEERRQKEEERCQKEEERRQKEEERRQKEEERRQKEEERRQKEEALSRIRALALLLLESGQSPASVSRATGLSLEELAALKKP